MFFNRDSWDANPKRQDESEDLVADDVTELEVLRYIIFFKKIQFMIVDMLYIVCNIYLRPHSLEKY